MSVLVVGGGISGLAAALELGRAGVPVTLVEASHRLGGKIATEHVDGFTIEEGPDSMLTTRPAGVSLVRELGLGDDLVNVREPRTVHILRDGRPVPMPDGLGLILPTKVRPFIGTRLFSWPEKARMGLDLVMPRLIPDDDQAVGTYLRRRLGSAVVDRLAGPLVGGIYGTSIDELSLDAVVPQLREAERTHRSLLLAGLADGRRMRAAAAARATSASGPGPGSGTAGARRPLGIFASLRGGLGDLVTAVEHALAETRVVTVVLDTRVERLEPAGRGIRTHLSDGRVIPFDAAIVTTPGPAAAGLVAPFSAGAAGAILEIPHASSTVVTLAFRDEAFPERPVGHGWLIPRSEGLPISALTFSSSKWADRAPDGHLLLRAFLPGEPGSTRAPGEAISLVRAALMRLLRLSAEPDLVRIASYEDTMPRYTVGHLGRVTRAEAELAAHPAVVLAGSPYRGVGLPDCIAGARSAAGTVLGRLGVAESASA